MFRPLLLVLALLSLGSASLQAQFDSTTLAGRAVLRRVARLERDPRLARFMAAGGFDNPNDPWGTGPVDDSTVVLMVELMARAIERDEGPICRSLVATGDDFLVAFVAAIHDSLEAEQWADMIERGVWSTNSLGNMKRKWPVAPPDEVRKRMFDLLGGELSPADQAIVARTRENPNQDQTPLTCLLLRLIFRDLTTEPPEVAGAVLRGMYTMGTKN